MDHVRLTPDVLSVEAATELVTHESCGAVSLFVGTTRDNFQGKKVVRLEYEAYEPMALKAMKNLCTELREKWPDIYGIAIHHRLGHVAAREASVVIAVSSAHRATSLAAVAHGIDQLKATVPVWKKEVYEDGAVWKENSECSQKRKLDEPIHIDKSLVQINVSCDELQKRIQSFIDRKREQVNLSNIHDFIEPQARESETDDTCARVRAVFVKRSDSKCHLKVHRVNNEWGPQTVRQPNQPDKPPTTASCLPHGLEERVQDIEKFLNIRSVTPDIYKRLKEMEDRIRHLESISPEYASFWRNKSEDNPGVRAKQLDCRYTADEINQKIKELEKQDASSWSNF